MVQLYWCWLLILEPFLVSPLLHQVATKKKTKLYLWVAFWLRECSKWAKWCCFWCLLWFLKSAPSIHWKWKENNRKNWKTNVNYIAPFPVGWKTIAPLRRRLFFFWLHGPFFLSLSLSLQTRCNDDKLNLMLAQTPKSQKNRMFLYSSDAIWRIQSVHKQWIRIKHTHTHTSFSIIIDRSQCTLSRLPTVPFSTASFFCVYPLPHTQTPSIFIHRQSSTTFLPIVVRKIVYYCVLNCYIFNIHLINAVFFSSMKSFQFYFRSFFFYTQKSNQFRLKGKFRSMNTYADQKHHKLSTHKWFPKTSKTRPTHTHNNHNNDILCELYTYAFLRFQRKNHQALYWRITRRTSQLFINRGRMYGKISKENDWCGRNKNPINSISHEFQIAINIFVSRKLFREDLNCRRVPFKIFPYIYIIQFYV